MELKALVTYSAADFILPEGDTTVGREDVTEERKQFLAENFPEWFEVLEVVEEKKGKK